ncbi:MAG TPA: polyhydroxyalkanoate depolymerase [Burkholderiales bacterium]|nr:polyhydroxyalkanoate depolymerase [Burkholderiales bacterium]
MQPDRETRQQQMLYQAYQSQQDALWLTRFAASAVVPVLSDMRWGLSEFPSMRKLAAACEVFTLADVTHRRPAFGIDSVTVAGREVPVVEEAAHRTPFGTLLHFRKDVDSAQPRVLLVAPMSGHFATLLRETVRTMLADHDVYITDWHNARDIPLADGRFGLDEYVEHLITFLGVMGPGAHMVAICQPCVAALAAVAIMAEDGHAAAPLSLTLMAGPIDCRVSPTEVNKLATAKPIAWFEDNLIGIVPTRYPGALRQVSPGFLQLMAFMNMNLERHVNSFREFYDDLVKGDDEKANAKRRFYQEYFAVADLPAEFYLETVSLVFQEYALPRGQLEWRGRRIDPRAIRRTALLTVEGEKDDICALGQTLAAQDLCASLRQYMRTHYIQAGVGHYGVFSGKRWNNNIYPVVRDVIHVSE